MKHGKRRQGKKRQAGASAPPAEAAETTGTAGSSETAEGSTSRVTLPHWYESEPGRLEFELAELEAAGIDYEVDERAKDAGVIVLSLSLTTEAGERLRLIARFPDIYPYMRFEVSAPDLSLDRHQNPLGKQLCLIGRATHNWRTTDTLASYIRERLPLVLQGARSTNPAKVAELEEHQGEPFSDYYPYRDDYMLLVEGGWKLDPVSRGGILMVGFNGRSGPGLRGAVLEVIDERGLVMAEADHSLSRLYGRQLDFRWVRCDDPIKESDLSRFFEALYARDNSLRQPRWRSVNSKNYDIVGVLFPEEHRWRQQGDGWVFAIREKAYGGGQVVHFLARAGRAGMTALTERGPELRPLRECKVSIVGLGALGAPSALELARSGVAELRVLDYDYVDPATTVRWPLGLAAAGRGKVAEVNSFLADNYPHTRVVPFKHRIGALRANRTDRSDNEVLAALLNGVDLIYDASAEVGLNHLLSDLAAERCIPYISVSTTHGAWGGRLIRVRPDRTEGCWMCHQWGLLRGELPSPSADPGGEVQPAGCSDPTFTGAGFDVAEIALAGVRLGVSTLAAGEVGGYPEFDWDVAVIHLRDENGRLLAQPRWETFPLGRHRECENEQAHNR
jgi:molybdopterin/thiamine biosynthesis adenylyltransferase